MRIAVIGTGYVGLVAAACLAEKGHQTICMDVNQTRVDDLRSGRLPYYEPGLEDMVRKLNKAGSLSFTGDVAWAVRGADVVFITVGTPSCEDGSVDLTAVFEAAEDVGRAMDGYQVVVVKSTTPPGTVEEVRNRVARHAKADFAVLSNPEFLREGQAVYDFVNPDRVLIGGDDQRAINMLKQLYAPFAPPDQILVMDSRSAEIAKYTSNAFLATRVSFINEIANLCQELGADIEHVRQAVGMDPRIGAAYFSPGLGYGGSCLPKDLRAMLAMGRQVDASMELLNAVQSVNRSQPLLPFHQISKHFEGMPASRKITVWGLSFKAETDDLRESPSFPLIRALVDAGSRVTAYDPKTNEAVHDLLGGEVLISDDQYASIEGAEALVVATDWEQFKQADLPRIRGLMRRPVIFDGRNIYDPKVMSELGFTYYGVGRITHPPKPVAKSARQVERDYSLVMGD